MSSKKFEGVILLDTQDPNTYQEVYSSQSYGTYYSVVAHFNVFESAEDSEKLRIDDISLNLLNYKGPVNLFISNAEIKLNQKYKDREGIEMPENGIYIKITVKVDNKPTLHGTIGSFIDLTTIYPNPEDRIVDVNSVLLVTRELLSINGSTFDELPEDGGAEGREAIVNGIFDTEFYIRNGSSNFKKKEKKDFDLSHPTDATVSSNMGLYDIKLNGPDTISCRQNKSLIKYV